MATADDVREFALSLDGTVANPHMDRTAFKVRRIYATLAADGLSLNLKLLPDEQKLKCLTHPDAFEPVSGGWGRMGWTRATLEFLTPDELRGALTTAWMHGAAKKSAR